MYLLSTIYYRLKQSKTLFIIAQIPNAFQRLFFFLPSRIYAILYLKSFLISEDFKKEEESNIMKAMILDVDGTLWDTTGVVAEAWMQAASELMIPLDTPITADRLKQEFGKPMDEIAANLFPTLSESQRALVMESCCEYEEFYLENAREPLLFDGVKETILTLSQNYAVCIVSNCQKGYIELFLKKTGLENAITDFECFGNTRLSKGENIRLLMERTQITDAVYVGDTKGDADACTFAGIPFIFAEYGFGSPTHYAHKITRFPELLEYPF